MHDRVVTRSVGDIEILPQDLPDTIERAKRRIGDGVSDLVIRSGPTTLTPHEVIFTILLKHKRAFHVILGSYLFINRSVLERYKSGKVFIQAYHVAVFPTTVIHIILIIVSVVENKLIDRLRPVHDLVDQRLTQQILIRPFRTIAHGNTDTSDLSLVHVIRPKEKIILTVLVDYRRSPHSDLRPFHLSRIKNGGMLGPTHQILGREAIEEGLLLI